MVTRRFGVVATAIDAPTRGELRYRPDALIVVGSGGEIETVLEEPDADYEKVRTELDDSGRLTVLGPNRVVIPGLVDLHVHAPQWPQLGKALDVPLEDWLGRYTFPLEARYDDVVFAETVYRSLVGGLLRHGTTTAVYFGTIHPQATEKLVDVCLEAGQRAVVGKVAMDLEANCPDYYRDPSAAAAVEETARFIEYVRSHSANRSALVMPAATPRFLPSCTDDLLDGLGELVAAEACLVQTHCSESDWAHAYGINRFGHSDTMTYDEFGLLQRGTVLAHSNFVDGADLALIASRGAAVAHCPLSNAFFANAVFPARHAMDRGVFVGLGTDIAGGPSPSLFRTAATAVVVSRIREDGVDPDAAPAERGVPDSRISFAEAFWMATAGGGQALDLPVGVLAPGYRCDMLAINTSAADSDLAIWPDFDSPADVLQKIVNNVGPENIERVWVDGMLVAGQL